MGSLPLSSPPLVYPYLSSPTKSRLEQNRPRKGMIFNSLENKLLKNNSNFGSLKVFFSSCRFPLFLLFGRTLPYCSTVWIELLSVGLEGSVLMKTPPLSSTTHTDEPLLSLPPYTESLFSLGRGHGRRMEFVPREQQHHSYPGADQVSGKHISTKGFV